MSCLSVSSCLHIFQFPRPEVSIRVCLSCLCISNAHVPEPSLRVRILRQVNDNLRRLHDLCDFDPILLAIRLSVRGWDDRFLVCGEPIDGRLRGMLLSEIEGGETGLGKVTWGRCDVGLRTNG
jgi:hypothetical protein